MEKFDPGINIGKTIADRVKGYLVLKKELKKRIRKVKSGVKNKPKKRPPCWIICPSFIVEPPKRVTSKEQLEKEYPLTVTIYGETRKERDEALDYMIRCGQEEIEAGDKRFWLYGFKQSVRRRGFWEAELKYFFRVKQVPEEIS